PPGSAPLPPFGGVVAPAPVPSPIAGEAPAPSGGGGELELQAVTLATSREAQLKTSSVCCKIRVSICVTVCDTRASRHSGANAPCRSSSLRSEGGVHYRKQERQGQVEIPSQRGWRELLVASRWLSDVFALVALELKYLG